MKIQITITQKEKDKILAALANDPCDCVDCSQLSCEVCPLSRVADKLSEAKEAYVEALNSLPVGGAE